MSAPDWKERLAELAKEKNVQTAKQEPEKKEAILPPYTRKLGRLCIRYEKRNGKPNTIISEFQDSEQELRELAKQLKKTLGIGGSAKDDEILLQGDVRQKIVPYLLQLGYSLKGDYKKNGPRS